MTNPTKTGRQCLRRRWWLWRFTGECVGSVFVTTLVSVCLLLKPFSQHHVWASSDATLDTKVVGYYGPHQLRERNGLSTAENINFKQLTRIVYGPFRINSHGDIWGKDATIEPELLFGPYDWNPQADAPNYCHISSPGMQEQCGKHVYKKGLIYGAHDNGVEVYPTIGGRKMSAEFSEVAANPAGRAKFAENAILLVKNYNFDGLDIAWQFPQSLEDMSNYIILLRLVKSALNKEGQYQRRTFGLTATVPCNEEMENIDISLLDSVLSEFNLVSFDFHGPWDGKVGANSPLYDQHREEGSVNSCVFKYLEGGAHRNKLNLGLAFSGHSFRGAKYIGDECKANWAGICSDTQSWQEGGGSPQYYSIYKALPDMTLSFDLETSTPLASYEQGVVSFDDPRSICLKTEYAIANQLNGLFIVDLGGDMLDDRSTPLLDALTLKLLKQNIECLSTEFEQLFQWRKVAQYNSHADVESNTPNSETDVAIMLDSKPEAKYICGAGQGNAEEECNSPEMVSCNHGTCPSNLVCFVVLCAKPPMGNAVEQAQYNSNADVKTNTQSSETAVATTSDSKPEAKYICGAGQGNAKEDCNSPDMVSCNHGTCPSNLMCFVVLCTTPPTGNTVEEGHTKVSFSKAYPKPKPRRKPVTKKINPLARAPPVSDPEGDTLPRKKKGIAGSTEPINTDPASFSCGINFGNAKSCTKLCPNGITDCPSGQFCFWLKCEAPSVSTENAVALALTEAKYQCGETRSLAQTCSEDCGYEWHCPKGKDCYSVQCPVI